MTTLTAARRAPQEQENPDLDALAHGLVSDLHAPRPLVFWTDLLVSAAVGWAAFVSAIVIAPVSLPLSGLMCAAASIALYRGLCFTHEISHLRRRSVPGFETTWNLLFGVPLLLPSFTYIGVHQSHHSLSTYGTADDPEYLPFADSRKLMIFFGIQASFLVPPALFIRFVLLAPIGLVWPRFHGWLEAHASSFAMNPAYRRVVGADMSQKIRRWELVAVAEWSALLALLLMDVVPGRALGVWFVVLTIVSLLNTLRVLGAHEYETSGAPRSRQGQLADSIDTPGGPWTELWAPVGLRYHALHHYFPGIPYHNLGQAYRRLVEALPTEALDYYRESTSPSLPHSLKTLYLKAKARGALMLRGPIRRA